MRYPKSKDIQDFLNEISDDDFAFIPSDEVSNIDKTKYELCKKFVVYLREKNLSQAELARILYIDRSRVNWIVKYRIDNFTIDKLYELWAKIEPDFQLKVS